MEHTRRVSSKEYAGLKRAATNRATLEARRKAEVEEEKKKASARIADLQDRLAKADEDRDFWRKKCEQYHRMILRDM